MHTLIGMGSAALLLLCLTQVRRLEFPTRDKEVLKKKTTTKKKKKKKKTKKKKKKKKKKRYNSSTDVQ